MPKKCSVVGCTTNRDYYEPGLYFFHVPRENLDLQARWVELIGRDPDWKVPAVPTVCEKHFTRKQVMMGRNLDPDVVPSLNLPEQSTQQQKVKKRDDSSSDTDDGDEDLLTECPPAVKPVSVQKKIPPPKRSRRRVQQPELVLVEAKDDVIYPEACCRLCSLELKVSEGLTVADARESELVCDPVWDVCLVQNKRSKVEHGEKICNDCWCKMQEFSNFVENCHQQQKLRRVSSRRQNERPQREEPDEPPSPPIDFIVKDEQVESEIDNTEDNTEEPVAEERIFELPPLEGLSIDEMLEVLDKVVVQAPRRTKHDPNRIDMECLDCGKMFPNRNKMKEHRKTCSAIGSAESLRNKSYTCDICSKPFRNRIGYRTHLQKMHGSDPSLENTSEELKRLQSKKRLQCPLCPDRFHQLHQLKYHLKTHKVKSLSTTKYIRNFQKNGESSKTFYCEVCDKTFHNTSYLSLHMKFHKRERDFACDQCDKKFFVRTDLKNHIMNVHKTHSFLCGTCGKTFGTQRYLNRHTLRHHNTDPSVKTYQCTYCPKSFFTPSDLKYHVTGHTGERSHKCEVCGQAFRFRHTLTNHKKNKHGMQVDRMLLAKVDDYYEEFEEVLDEQVLNEEGAERSEESVFPEEMAMMT